jgi:hypothetical protein
MRAITADHERRWNNLHSWLRNNGACITSTPYASPVRMQCRVGSSLPKVLEEKNYRIRHVGNTEGFAPVAQTFKEHGQAIRTVTREQLAPVILEIWEFAL